MAISVILHISNEDPVLGEVEEFPTPGTNLIVIHNPRRVDGKDLHYLAEGVTVVMWPVQRMNFLEILPSREEEEIIGFVRE